MKTSSTKNDFKRSPASDNKPIKRSSAKKALLKAAAAAGSLIFWVGLWQLASFWAGDEFFIPKPLSVLEEMTRLPGRGEFLPALGVSVLRVLAGYAAGVIIGILLALLTSFSKILRALFEPLLSVIRATPVVSFIILAFLLFDRSGVPSYIVILMVAPLIWANLSEGIANIDLSLKEMTSVFRFSPLKSLKHLYIPALLPYFASSAVTAFGFAWKSGVAAEIICYPDMSLGKMIYRSRVALDSISVFALTAYVIILSIIFEKILKRILARVKSNRQSVSPENEKEGVSR